MFPLPDLEKWYERHPWIIRPSDVGLHGAPTYSELERPLLPYWLFFVFLRLSPSYAIAQQLADAGSVPDEELLRASTEQLRDLEAVIQTYVLFGDVRRTFFTVWWRERAAKAFGGDQPLIRFTGLKDFAVYERCAASMMASATKDKSLANWRLAAWLKPDDPTSKAVMESANAGNRWVDKTFASNEKADRDVLKANFNRDLGKAERLAENAARGRFPSDAPTPPIKFDYVTIGQRISDTGHWEESEKKKAA